MARVYGARQNTYGNMITMKSAGWSREEGSGARETRMVSRSRSGAASHNHSSWTTFLTVHPSTVFLSKYTPMVSKSFRKAVGTVTLLENHRR